MSRSPRKQLHRAVVALDELAALQERYPEVRDELVDVLGDEGMNAVLHARSVITEAARRMDARHADASESGGNAGG